MILLVHSCKGREAFLDIWKKCFERSGWDIPTYYITDDREFTDQLIEALNNIGDSYIWYTLDDLWIKEPLDWEFYERLARGKDALRMQPNVRENSLPYRFRWEGSLLRQTNQSAYQISLHVSIWRRQFFLDCLTPGLDPWEQERSTKIDNWNHKIYFVPRLPFWVINGTVKGALTKEGQEVVKWLA